MVRALTISRPAPRISETARSERAFAEFERTLVSKFETELGQNKDTNAQTGPYVRKNLILQLLAANKSNPNYLKELQAKFPAYAEEISTASSELATWSSPLAVRAQNNNAVADQLIWPAPGSFATTLQQQAQSGNADYRRRVALDLIVRQRLVQNDAYSAIERAIPAMYPWARTLAGRIAPEEYPLFRLELLNLPLADQSRIYFIRNTAIDIQNLLKNNGDGQKLRSAVHNSAGPANVPLVAETLINYFQPDESGNKPSAVTIADLMRARRWLKAGDRASIGELVPSLTTAFKGRKPDLARVLADGDLGALEKFIEANVRLAPSLPALDASLELLPSKDCKPVPAETKKLIIDCAQAIEAGDASTAAALATQAQTALQQIAYPHAWATVAGNANAWRDGNAAAQANARTALQTFLQAAQMPSAKMIAAMLMTAQDQTPKQELVDKISQLFTALASNQLDTVYQLFPQLLTDLENTPVHATFNQYGAYITPANRNRYNANQLLGFLIPAFKNNTQSAFIQSGTSNGASYSPIDVYDKLAVLYEEVAELYNGKAELALIERAFPVWAPNAVREGLYRTAASLKAGDRLYAAKEIGVLREAIRGEIMPHDGPRAATIAAGLSRKVGGRDPELSAILASIGADANDAAAVGRLEDYLAAHAGSTQLTKSRTTVTSFSNRPVTPEALAMINDLRAKIEDGDAAGALALIPQLAPHFQTWPNWPNHVAQTATSDLGQNPPNIWRALYYLDHFLIGANAQQTSTPGSITTVPPLKPTPEGVPPSPAGVALLQQCLDFARANDQPNFKRAWQQVQQHFNNIYPTWATTAQQIGNLANQAGVIQLAPFLEEFILQTRGVADEDLKAKLTLGDGKKAPADVVRQLLELRGALREPTSGQENLRLIQLDGVLEDISTNLLAALGEEHAEVTDKNIGSALLSLSAALSSSIAGGLPDVKPDLINSNRRLSLFGAKKEEAAGNFPELRELAEHVDALLEKSSFQEADLVELRSVCDQISERVWQTYVDLKEVFEPRLEKAKDQNVGDPFFVDNLIKQGPLTHLKSISDAVHAWSMSKLGPAKPVAGAVLENPKGIRVMSEGRAVLERIVIAESLKDVPRKVVLDENTLLILGTVGNENISMAGSVVVNRAKADGAGAGGQFSHIFVWTRNTGIAGVAFENATQVVADFQSRFADKLAAGEEIYLEASGEGFRLGTVSEAIERGWMKANERESLRPGVNTFVRFMVPNGSGKSRPDLDSIRVNKKRPGKPFLEIEIAYPMQRLNQLGEQQISFADLINAGPEGAHADSLVGPKAAVLARARHSLKWQNVVLPGQAMPFGQVFGLLERSGAIDALRKLEPSLSMDSDAFWKSKLMTDGAYRTKQCAAIQESIRRNLRTYLFDDSGQLTEAARAQLIDPLRANPELVGPDGNLKPLIARSTANSEDAADFNAAGKHKSVANLVSEEQIANAVIEVIASLYNLEALETRRLFGVDSRVSAMSVLFQPVEQPEISGVLVTRQNDGPAGTFAYQATRGLFGGVHGDAQIQVAELGQSAGERRVLVPYNAAKMVVVDPVNGGTMEKEVDPAMRTAANLLTPEQETTLYQYATQLKQLFNQHIYPGQNLELDIEWMIVGGQVKITQARPLPRPMA